MMAIVKEISNGFAIQFPFELKDSFKEAFPSAKWNSAGKQWEVGVRSGNRLKQWAESIESNLESLIEAKRELEERELSVKEVRSINDEISSIEQEIIKKTNLLDSLPALHQQAVAAKKLLLAKKDKLDEVKAAIESKSQLLKEERQRVNDLLSEIIDISEIKSDAHVMAKNMKLLDQVNKKSFHDAQGRIAEHSNRLREAGFALDAIDFLVSSNKNRPDRDNPEFITDDMWYRLREVPSTDED